MTYLADDLLEGREAGTRGDALAQLYIRSAPSRPRASARRGTMAAICRPSESGRRSSIWAASISGSPARAAPAGSPMAGRRLVRRSAGGRTEDRGTGRLRRLRDRRARTRDRRLSRPRRARQGGGGARRSAGLPAGVGSGALRLVRPAAADRGGSGRDRADPAVDAGARAALPVRRARLDPRPDRPQLDRRGRPRQRRRAPHQAARLDARRRHRGLVRGRSARFRRPARRGRAPLPRGFPLATRVALGAPLAPRRPAQRGETSSGCCRAAIRRCATR